MSERLWPSFPSCVSFLCSSFSTNTPGVPGKYRTFSLFLISKSSEKGLLQRHNFPLHFLSRTKTPFKWMAFAHSLRPQLAALLPTPIQRPQSGRTDRQADGGGWGGDGTGRGDDTTGTHMKQLQLLLLWLISSTVWLNKVLIHFFLGYLIFLWCFQSPRRNQSMCESHHKPTAGFL